MAERRSTRERKVIRENLNEVSLTNEASQGQIDDLEDYERPRGRRRADADEEEADDDGEEEEEDGNEEDEADQETRTPKRGRKPRGRPPGSTKSPAVGAPSPSTRAPARRRGGKETAEEREIDLAELPSPIYQVLAHQKAAVATVVKEIIQQYKDPKKSNAAKLGIINFMLQSVGCTREVLREDLESDTSEVVAACSELSYQSSLEPPFSRVRGFQERWIQFWQMLVNEADRQGVLDDEVLFDAVVLPWMNSIAASLVRTWRHNMTVAAFALLERLNELAVAAIERNEVIEKQKKDPKLVAKGAKALREESEANDVKLDVIHSLLKSLFGGVFVHRFRDLNEEVRLLCIERLTNWLATYPQYWLVDNHLKYVGWTLNDKAPRVRLASVQACLNVLPDEKSKNFIARFIKRIESMTSDIDDNVAAAAVAVMVAQLKMANLDESEGKNIPALMWDENPTVRENAVQFVFDDSFADELANENHEEDINQLANILDLHCPLLDKKDGVRSVKVAEGQLLAGHTTSLQAPVDVLVNGFWSSLPALHDFGALTKLIIASAKPSRERGSVPGSKSKMAPVDEDRQRTLLHFLVAVCKRATGHMEDASIPAVHNTKKKDEREALVTVMRDFSAHFATVANQLFGLFQLDADKIPLLFQVLHMIDLSVYTSLRLKSDFTELLSLIRNIFLKNSTETVLEEAAATLRYLSESDHSFKDEARDLAVSLAIDIAKDLNASYNRVHGSASARLATQDDDNMDSDEKLVALHVTLVRLTCLQRSIHLPELQWDALPNLEKTLQFYASSHSEVIEQKILLCLMHAAFSTLNWNMIKLQNELGDDDDEAGEDEDAGDEEMKDGEEEEEEKGNKRGRKPASKKGKSKKASSKSAKGQVNQKLLKSTHRLEQEYLAQLEIIFAFTAAQAHEVKEAAFRLLSDCFILFTGKLVGTPLSDLAISTDRLRRLQHIFNNYFLVRLHNEDMASRIDRSVPKETRIAFSQDSRILACSLACKVVMYDTNSLQIKDAMNTTLRHKELAGIMLARYGQLGDEFDSILKLLQSQLKSISTNTLLMAQLEALKHCLLDNVDQGGMKTLATKFVLVHNINPNSRSFEGFFRHGLVFALQLPERLRFLELLIPFVQRASPEDVKICCRTFAQYGTQFLGRHDPADREGDEWDAISALAHALNKKFGVEVMELSDRAVKINPKSAKVIPATPATPAKGRKKDDVTGGLTPMASPAQRGRPSGARSGRPSEVVLRPVAEEPVNDSRRKSGGTKRGHREVEEEEEERKSEEDDDEAAEEDEDAMETDEIPKKRGGRRAAAPASPAEPRRGRKRGADQ